MVDRIYLDEIGTLKFTPAQHLTQIVVSKGKAHNIVRDRATGKDVGIIFKNGNSKRFNYRIFNKDQGYLFFKENPTAELTAFYSYNFNE